MIALFSMLTSLISWGLSLIFSGLLPANGQAGQGNGLPGGWSRGYLGLGAVWALGFPPRQP